MRPPRYPQEASKKQASSEAVAQAFVDLGVDTTRQPRTPTPRAYDDLPGARRPLAGATVRLTEVGMGTGLVVADYDDESRDVFVVAGWTPQRFLTLRDAALLMRRWLRAGATVEVHATDDTVTSRRWDR